MPTPSYTKILYSVTNSSGPYPMTLPTPSVGTVWVLRDICLYFPPSAGAFSMTGHSSLLVGGNQVASTPIYATIAGVLYETRDVRQTVEASTAVQLVASAPGWNLQVTGYAFSS